jgi:hypothetical protein
MTHNLWNFGLFINTAASTAYIMYWEINRNDERDDPEGDDCGIFQSTMPVFI